MALTDKQIYDLNNMNVAAQNIQLGTFLHSLKEEVDTGGIFYCEYNTTSFDVIFLAFQAGKYIICKINLDGCLIYAPLKIFDGNFNFKGWGDWETPVWVQIGSNNQWYMEKGGSNV